MKIGGWVGQTFEHNKRPLAAVATLGASTLLPGMNPGNIGGDAGDFWNRNKQDIARYAPLALAAIPGVGPLAAAGLGAGVNYGANHDPASALMSGAMSYGLGNIASHIPGASSAGDWLNKIPGASTVGDWASKLGDFQKYLPQGKIPGAQSVQDLLGGLGSSLGGGGGQNALELAQGLNAAYLGQKSSNYADMAAGNADQAWQQRAPLRAAGVAGMLNPDMPDMSALQGIGARGNPFARPMPVGGNMGAMPGGGPQGGGSPFAGQGGGPQGPQSVAGVLGGSPMMGGGQPMQRRLT